jgi:hypothetical protein
VDIKSLQYSPVVTGFHLKKTFSTKLNDEGMTHWVLIFGLSSLKPRSEAFEGMIQAHERNQLAWPRSQDLAYTARTRRRRSSRIRKHLGFHLPPLSVVSLESNPETQPSHIKGWEGEPRTWLDTFHLPPERSNPRELINPG